MMAISIFDRKEGQKGGRNGCPELEVELATIDRRHMLNPLAPTTCPDASQSTLIEKEKEGKEEEGTVVCLGDGRMIRGRSNDRRQRAQVHRPSLAAVDGYST
jgi:hypothetical protein